MHGFNDCISIYTQEVNKEIMKRSKHTDLKKYIHVNPDDEKKSKRWELTKKRNSEIWNIHG